MPKRPFPRSLSRRDFLKLTGLAAASLALRPLHAGALADFPAADYLARNCTGGMIPIKTLPDAASATVRDIYEDTVLAWLREVPALNLDYNRKNQRWVETPEGYVYSTNVQQVRNLPNTPMTALPSGSTGGFWAQVSVPYVDLYLDNPPARSPGLNYLLDNGLPVRLYYSQIVWIDQVRVNDSGTVMYRFNEAPGYGYGYGDIFWAEGQAFYPLAEADLAPIHPEVDPNEKRIEVNLTNQNLSCFEGTREVYFCRISSGRVDYETPAGDFAISRKLHSIHMAAGTVDAGYDTMGIGWTSFFATGGVAIHSTFWHNQFGEPRSHGCINCRPEDSLWIYRWTTPYVGLQQSESQLQWPEIGTRVRVYERLY